MNISLSEEDKKNTVSWNIALTQASLNIYFMESNSTIANLKKERRRLYIKYLVGMQQMEYQHGDPAFDSSIWEEKTKAVLLKNKRKHEDTIKQMTRDFEKKRKEINKDIFESDKKISEYKKSIAESKSVIEQTSPSYDLNTICDLNDLKRKIEEENKRIRLLEQIQ